MSIPLIPPKKWLSWIKKVNVPPDFHSSASLVSLTFSAATFFFSYLRAKANAKRQWVSSTPNPHTHTHLVLRLLGPSRFLFRVSSLGRHDFVLGLRGGVCVCQVLSLKKSVTFSCVERGLVFERGIGGIGIGIDANVSDRTNEADGVGECVEGAGFGRLTITKSGLQNIVTSHFEKSEKSN